MINAFRKYALFASCIALGAAAFAGSDEFSSEGNGYDKPSACKAAKDNARSQLPLAAARSGQSMAGTRITNYGYCDCSEDKMSGNPTMRWHCAVDVSWTGSGSGSSSSSSSSNYSRSGSGVFSSKGNGFDKPGACKAAKDNARGELPLAAVRSGQSMSGARITSTGYCDCSENKKSGSPGMRWYCAVDVNWVSNR